MANLKKLQKVAKVPAKSILKQAEERLQNRKWLKYSQNIALLTLEQMENKKMSQKALANAMEVSPQYVNKLLKGKEKLNIETISKIEDALNISLITVGVNKKIEKKPTKVLKIDFTRNLNTVDTFKLAQ